jgi:hypothetical protein
MILYVLPHKIDDGVARMVVNPSQQSTMSAIYILSDANGDAFHLQSHYIRHRNRILDASFIASISVKKNKVLFNNFKQNTTLPCLTVPFKTNEDARQVMDNCAYLYNLSKGNYLYDEDDKREEEFITDAYGGSLQVTPEFLRYRDRIIGVHDVRSLHLKGRRVLVNHFKGNMSVPTMCVHFEDKAAAAAALNTIHSLLWNVEENSMPLTGSSSFEKDSEDGDDIEDSEESDMKSKGTMESALELLDKPADPVFLYFMLVGMSTLLLLSILQVMIGPVDIYEL